MTNIEYDGKSASEPYAMKQKSEHLEGFNWLLNFFFFNTGTNIFFLLFVCIESSSRWLLLILVGLSANIVRWYRERPRFYSKLYLWLFQRVDSEWSSDNDWSVNLSVLVDKLTFVDDIINTQRWYRERPRLYSKLYLWLFQGVGSG